MFPGFNTEIECDNLRYHIQTEVLPGKDPAILTLVYRGGAIINRVKRSCGELLGESPTEEELRFLAERQHRRVMDELRGGRQEPPPASAVAAPPPSGPEPAEAESLEQLIRQYLDGEGAADPRRPPRRPGR